MLKRVCLDPGHGGLAPGASYLGLLEKDVNLAIALRTKDELEKFGFAVVLTRDGDDTVSLLRRCQIANAKSSGSFVSIHCNADPDMDLPGMSEARGEEIWYHPKSRKGKEFAEIMYKSVDQIFPDEAFRGIKPTESLYVLNGTLMPADRKSVV